MEEGRGDGVGGGGAFYLTVSETPLIASGSSRGIQWHCSIPTFSVAHANCHPLWRACAVRTPMCENAIANKRPMVRFRLYSSRGSGQLSMYTPAVTGYRLDDKGSIV
jgi:hypothetical protein